MKHELILRGVRQNNLKNIDLDIPLGKKIVVTGPSGSGKSSLAFETIYAEGQRRYMQSLSTYARQFLEKFKAPLVDKIQNIPPTIALEQINPVRNSRSTVGTNTELNDYFRLLFEKVGVEYCTTCDCPYEKLSIPEIVDRITKKYANKTLIIASESRSSFTQENLEEFQRNGFSRLILKDEIFTIEDVIERKIKPPKKYYIVIDRIMLANDETEFNNRISESVRSAIQLNLSDCALFLKKEKNLEYQGSFTTKTRCPKCQAVSPTKTSHSFSFNSPLGACSGCKGFGNTLEVDENKVIPNPKLSISRGAIDPLTKPSLREYQKKLRKFCEVKRIDADLPYRELSHEHKKAIFFGEKGFLGIAGIFKKLEEERYKMRIRVFISRYVSPFACKKCNGARFNESTLNVQVGGKNLAQVLDLPIGKCLEYVRLLPLNKIQKEIAVDILKQLERRLSTLNTLGLHYLSLSRLTKTLSGGEYQRILLATQLSQGLTDTLYVLDEPSIGLHPKDTQKLLSVLENLHSLGNSLLLVEHDPEVIEWGEYILDIGPGSGSRGGEVVFKGSKQLFMSSDSITSKAVRNWRSDCYHALLKPSSISLDDCLEIKGACENNLKNIHVQIPLKTLTVVTGVSGSGKSTLVVDTLYQALSKLFNGTSDKIGKFTSLSGHDNFSGVELIDQNAIGKSSRSNPLTFIKGYDDIRSLLSNTSEAISKGYPPGYFSFNVAGGRCEKCEGEGRIKVEMVFMEDIWVPCEICDGKRFKPNILAIRYKGKNVDDILKMTISDAYDFFRAVSTLRVKLALLIEVGLGYLQLGQPSYTLSGGEAQRLKIAKELTQSHLKKSSTLFILDEPTTGLHFSEITRLLSVLRRLIQSGNTVIVIEHNIQVIACSDYIIDLGPDGGEGGGNVVAVGTPKELAQKKLPFTGLYLSEIYQK